ncbi:MAG: EscU/YscU/HrcU family type III secretion system export apparatus switch protein [Deltaproteobacteria bacterium]|nr:EscU/YscU/HrcU family type III secretion system export apparatus switch protein [Deltaproteobacteria bacterium]
MAENEGQEKTEQPTPRKRSEARKKGQVAKSQEVASLAVLLGGLSTLCLFGAFMYKNLMQVTHKSFSMAAVPIFDMVVMRAFSRDMVAGFIVIVLPMMIAVVVIGVAANVMQVGMMASWEALTPNLEKLNPFKGFKQLVSVQAMMELFKSMAKLTMVGTIAYITVKGQFSGLEELGKLEVSGIFLFISKVIFKVFFRVAIAMVCLAAIDYVFQRWQFEKRLKMTKQEVKEELKQTEGDPFVKSRIKKIQMEVARRRMMQSVPEADVVVTNPVLLKRSKRWPWRTMSRWLRTGLWPETFINLLRWERRSRLISIRLWLRCWLMCTS